MLHEEYLVTPIAFGLLLLALLIVLFAVALLPGALRDRHQHRSRMRELEGRLQADLAVLGNEVYQLNNFAALNSQAYPDYLAACQAYTRVSELVTASPAPEQLAAMSIQVTAALQQMNRVRQTAGLGLAE
jgi:hypothetical protein